MLKKLFCTFIALFAFGSAGAQNPGLVISEILANPAGTDSCKEYVELIATQNISFSLTPYTVIVNNNGNATSSGWVSGGALSYAFSITGGTVAAGSVVYVGGSCMTPTTQQLRVINVKNIAGDGGLGTANSAGVFGNGGSNADGVAVFNMPVGTITSSSVPVDAVFYGTSVGNASVTGGTDGYQLPLNDLYTGGKFGTGTFFAPDPASDVIITMIGEYNLGTNSWSIPRTATTGTLTTDAVSSVSLVTSGTVAPASMAFLSNDTTVSEAASSAVIYVKLTATSTNTSAISVYASALSNASSGDYTIAAATVTFAANAPVNSVAAVTLNINNDLVTENSEYVILRFYNPQNATIGSINQFNCYIADNDKTAPSASNSLTLNLLSSFSNGTSGSNSAEIVAHDPGSQRLFIANSIGAKLDIIDFVNPSTPSLVLSVPIATYGNINSVAVKNGIVACAIENSSNPQDSGKVVFFDVNGVYQNQVKVGMMPDMIAFNHAGTKVITANEGEPNQAYTNDPDGSISVVNIAGGISALTQTNVSHITFTVYNGQESTLRAQGIRIYGINASASKDFEPEYVSVSPDDTKAWVSLQENNALVEIDLSTNAINYIKALGTKNHALANNPMDMSNVTRSVNIANFPVKGFYLPDAIASYTVAGVPYVISANEGDARAYSGFSEERRVAQVTLDPVKFPNGNELKNNYAIGRLNITDKSGDIDNDGDIDTIYAYGSRSFSIWNANTGVQVYDSKDDLEQITATNSFSVLFNASNSNNTKKDRSDDKGPEPEGVAVGTIGGNTYAFIALERTGGVMVYDVTSPGAPTFVTYVNNRTSSSLGPDLGSEGIVFIPQNLSPNGMHIVIAANEVSSSLSIWGIPGCSAPLSSSLSITGSTLNACSANAPVLSVASATGVTYQWSQNGSAISGATNNSLAITSSGNYVVSISGGSNCATSSVTRSLTVNPSPTISVSGSTVVCAGASISQTISGANTYSWNGSTTSSVITLTPSASGQYTITALASNNCSSSATRSINVSALPVLTITPGTATICSGQTATFSASGASVYTWSNGATSTVLSVAPTTNTTYVLTGTNSSGCSNTIAATVSVNALPAVAISPASQVVCVGSAVSFTGTGATTYSWSTGSTNAVLQNTPVANGTYVLTGTNSAGCTNSAAAVVSVNPLPNLMISPASQSVCAGSVASFTASGASSYSWSNGSTNAVLQNTPSVNATYVLTGTNAAGCTNSTSASVVVNPVPSISFSLSAQTICAGETAAITATGADTYSWVAGGSGATLAINPSTTTIYFLTGYSSAGCTTTAQVTQNVNVCTGINELADADPEYIVYPNPTNGQVKISFGHSNDTEVKIISLTGTVVYEQRNYVSGTDINCELFSKGIYFVQINAAERQTLKKLVVE